MFVEYAKADAEDILIRITVVNRGPEAADAPPAADALVPQHLVVGTPDAAPCAASAADASADAASIAAEHPELGEYRCCATASRRRRAAVHRERDQHRAALRARRTHRRTSRTGSTTPSSTARRSAVNPGTGRHQGGGALSPATSPPGETRHRPPAALRRRRRRARPAVRGLRRRSSRSAQRRSRRVLRRRRSRRTLAADRRDVHAPGPRPACSGPSSTTTSTSTAGSRSTTRIPLPPSGTPDVRNRDWFHMLNGDVISMPDKWEYPWYAAWDLAFHTIALAWSIPTSPSSNSTLMLARTVPAPQRTDPGLRVELRRRQSARPRLGRAGRVYQHRAATRRAAATSTSSSAAFQKLLLNFTWWVNRKDPRGQQRLRGRLPRARQHRRLRPQRAAADRRPPRAGRRHRLDGVLRPEHARDRPGARGGRPGLRGHGAQVLSSTSSGSPPPWTASATPTTSCGTRRTASSTTCCACPTARRMRLKVRSMVGLLPLCAATVIEPEVLEQLPELLDRGSDWFVDHHPELVAQHRPRPGSPGVTGRRPALDAQRAQAPARLARMLDENEFLALRHPLALARPPRPSLRAFGVGRERTGSTTCRPNRRPACSAATRTGAARSGCRSTSSRCARCSSTTLLRRRLHRRVPDRLRQQMTLYQVAEELARPSRRRSSCATTTAAPGLR